MGRPVKIYRGVVEPNIRRVAPGHTPGWPREQNPWSDALFLRSDLLGRLDLSDEERAQDGVDLGTHLLLRRNNRRNPLLRIEACGRKELQIQPRFKVWGLGGRVVRLMIMIISTIIVCSAGFRWSGHEALLRMGGGGLVFQA